MRKKLSWPRRLPKGRIWEIREHALLAISVGEEDPTQCLEHLLKDVDEVMLVQTSEEDEALEDVAVADGAADVKEELL